VLELNPLPGILPDPRQNSCFPKAARADGMDFTALVNKVVEVARKRYGI
jgi:D-alanine-D-alanine ligase